MTQSAPKIVPEAGETVVIETAQLILRRPTLADVPTLFAFLGDSISMQHTHADASMEECRRRVATHEGRRKQDGYAPWTVLSKANGRIVGWGGLYNDPFDPGWGVEVGYFFHPDGWGRGYATELVTACTDIADHVLKLPVIRAFARLENIGSRRVLEKTGFEIVRHIPEMERLLYSRVRPDSDSSVSGSSEVRQRPLSHRYWETSGHRFKRLIDL